MHFFIIFLLIIVVYAVQDFSSIRPKGLYTAEEHIHSHEIVFPRKVTGLGKLISHNVTHLLDDDSYSSDTEMEELYYHLMMGGNKYQLKLRPVNSFIGRSLVVERHKRELHQRSASKNHSIKCHYRGIIQDQPKSRVVLSTCDGLAGFLHGDHGEVWLEPVAREHENRYRSRDKARPHLLFRRTRENIDVRKETVPAALMQEQSTAMVGRSKPRRKRKKKYERNCGTRGENLE